MLRRILVAVLVAACGTDSAQRTDAAIAIDAPPDGPPLPAGCDHVELADPTNDIMLSNGAAEPTGLVFAQSATVSARIDGGHFDGAATTIDVDGFELTVGMRAQVLVRFVGAGSESLASLEVQIHDATGATIERGAFLGSHVLFGATLDPGSYRLVVIAKNAVELAASIDYKLRVAADVPEARCAELTSMAAYSEADEAPLFDANDVVEVRYAPNERGLTAAADAPEPTAITTAAGTNLRIAGTSGDVDAADDFKDRDTYLVTTGAHDQLTVRIDWTGDADFDFMVFPENSVAELASGTTVAVQAPELATFPVLPNTRYWLWIGSFDTTTGLPIPYDATLCPTELASRASINWSRASINWPP